jgi:TolA-binding protein
MILSNLYPEHGLQDDIKYARAQIAMKERKYETAEGLFLDIIENHKEEIRADNAMFELANLYEHQLNQPDKAMELYERIFIEFSGSTFSIEARKRYRFLRGDFEEEPIN